MKRPRSDSIEFDDLVAGSSELLDIDGKGGILGGYGEDILSVDAFTGGADSNLGPGGDTSLDLGLGGSSDARTESWGTAIDEKEATRSREMDRKAEEDRAFEARAKAEADRLQSLQRDAEKKEEARQRAVAVEEQRKEEEQKKLLQAREEERRAREEMQQTVNLDQGHEALMMLDDI